MGYIEMLEKITEKSTLGNFYAVYFPKKKDYIIVMDYIEANKYRKGNYNLTEKFATKEEAINWAEECKTKDLNDTNKKRFYGIYFADTKEGLVLTNPEEVNKVLYKRSAFCRKFFSETEALEWIELVKKEGKDLVQKNNAKIETSTKKKKKYYGIYFIETGQGIILDSSENVATTVQNKPSYCRKFVSEETALNWLEVVKKVEKNIEPEDIRKYENKLNTQGPIQRYYGVYLYETQEAFVTNSIEKAELALKEEKGLLRKFKKEKDAVNWIVQCKNNQRIYYAIFFTEKLKSIIVFESEMLELLIKDTPNINKAFGTIAEADKWLKNIEYYYTEEMEKLLKDDTIFFDVGTGRGIGEEVRVSDFAGNSLLNKLEEYTGLINQYGNYNLGKINNTNYGELYGLYLALLIALRNNIYKIAGDSKTVINQWSKGEIILSKILPYEQELIYKVIDLRKEFEAKGGEVCYINASLNPADLGFHKNKRKVKVTEEVDNS